MALHPMRGSLQTTDVDVGTGSHGERNVLDKVLPGAAIHEGGEREEMEDLVRYHDEDTGAVNRARHRP